MPTQSAINIRDRIKEFRRVPSTELTDNDKNWRLHPYAQRRVLQELLEKIGIAGVCTAYYSERNGGKLTLIDGHMRKDEVQADLPTVILDVNDEEADLLLLTLDPMREMAESANAQLQALLVVARQETPALEDMLAGLEKQLAESVEEAKAEEEPTLTEGPPEMELQPFEHYDYIVVLFKSIFDFQAAAEKLGIKKVGFTLKDGKTRKIGLGRVVDGSKFLEHFK